MLEDRRKPASRRFSRWALTAAAALVALSISGCALHEVRTEVAAAEDLSFLAGRVSPVDDEGHVYVVLFAQAKEQAIEVAGIASLSSLQETWRFAVEGDYRYYLGAFRDLDGDLALSSGEPAAFLGSERELRVEPRHQIGGMHLELAPGLELPPGFHLDIGREPPKKQAALDFALGEIASLADERFSEGRATQGLWSYLSTMRETGAGIFFQEAYDPQRIPVLFVHGIGGSPRDFVVPISWLDNERFQAWYFSYPSGFRLDTVSRHFRRNLVRLCERLGEDSIYLVAHSMGGLVSRAMILQLQKERGHEDLVKLLVTLATPYEGHSAAKWGLWLTPEPVPSWKDMAPGSTFLKRLQQPLPDDLPFYLLFGYQRGGGGQFMPTSNDSVVEVSSQLPLWAQNETLQVRGYDFDHMDILVDDAPVADLLAILDETAGEP